MVSLTEAVYVGTIWYIWRDFGWQVFKRIGADRGIKRAYAWYQGTSTRATVKSVAE